MNLEWFKQHKLATGVIVVAGLIVLYLASKKSSGSSSLAGIVGQEQQGQLQMASLNAQLSAAGEQTSAQLQAEQIASNTQTQQEQDQVAANLVGAQIVYGSQSKILEDEISARQSELSTFAPEVQSITSELASGKLAGHTAEQQSLVNELELLLGETNPNVLPGAGGITPVFAPSGNSSAGTGFNLQIPGIGSLGVSGL